MAIQTINIGTAINANDGEPIRTAFSKINDNFAEIDDRLKTGALNGEVLADNSVRDEALQAMPAETVKANVTGGSAAPANTPLADFKAALAIVAGDISELSAAIDARLPGYLFGLGIANNVSDPTNDIDFAAGVCASVDAAPVRIAPSAMTKRLDAAWAAGTGNGMRSSAALADGTWHFFAIAKAGGVDPDFFAHNAVDPTSVLPTDYVAYRRIASMRRVSGALQGIFQHGDLFLLKSPSLDATVASATTATLTTLTVPGGIRVQPILNVVNTTGTVRTYLSSPEVIDQAAPLAGSAPGYDIRVAAGGDAPLEPFISNHLLTNTSGQIRHRSHTTGGSLAFINRGWIDRRGGEA